MREQFSRELKFFEWFKPTPPAGWPPRIFEFCGELYKVNTKEVFNELYKLSYDQEWDALELLIEASEDIEKA